MGVDGRSGKIPLPAPTDEPSTLSPPTGGSVIGTDLATDVSRRTDKTSFSIPESGEPVTISTRRRKQDRERETEGTLSRSGHQSQTSLLIEYFEAGNGPGNVQSKPSVRVKVTPSGARKSKATTTDEHIRITETGRSRQPSYTKRISLSPRVPGEKHITESGDDKSLSSYASATEESNLASNSRGPPVDIEVMHDNRGGYSPRDQRYVQPNASDISSMPPESYLESSVGVIETRRPTKNRSRSMSREELITTENLKAPSRRRSRSLSRERITQKVLEKVREGKGLESTGKQKRSSKSRSRSVSKEHLELNSLSVKSPRRRSSKTPRDDDLTSGADSSVLTNSNLSPRRKSGEQYSTRSVASKSSINNPRLLETVEDAIRRLILPELSALKDEQKAHYTRNKGDKLDRDSVASNSSISIDDRRRKVSKSSRDTERPKVVLNRDERGPGLTLSGDSIKKKDRKSRKDVLSSPSDSYERGISDETIIDEKAHKKGRKDSHGLRNAAAAGVAGALTAAALRHHDSKSSVDDTKRRKKRSKSRSRSASLAESIETTHRRDRDIPPMPMSSDIMSSEVTRDSILTERTDRPSSARSRDRYHAAGDLGSPSARTPTKTPAVLQRTLGTHHSNLSQGDLSIHSTPSDPSLKKHDRGPTAAAALAGALTGGLAAKALEEGARSPQNEKIYDPNYEHDYSAGYGRALSPIQSVASYKEDSTLDPAHRNAGIETRSSRSLSSLGEAEKYGQDSAMSAASRDSIASAKYAAQRAARDSNLTESEVTYDSQDPKAAGLKYWQDDPYENEDHQYDDGSFRDPTIDLKHMTNYTDESMDGVFLDKVAAGRHVLGVGANPEYRHTPVAVSSAVASLHEPSVIDGQSTVSGRSRGDQSYADSYDDHVRHDDDRGFLASQQGSPTRSDRYASQHTGSASPTKRTFQQRAMGEAPDFRSGTRKDVDEHIPMSASGLPIADDPLPEIGHGLSDESEINTNPSIIQGPIGGAQHDNRDHWPYEPTPPHSNGNLLGGRTDRGGLSPVGAGLLGAAAGVGAGALLAGHKHDTTDWDGSVGAKEMQPKVEEEYDDDVNHDFGLSRNQPPAQGDEGYISAPHARSAGAATPESRSEMFDGNGMPMFAGGMEDDPYTSKRHVRHLSGNSHGMASPLYDAATGKGMDRIQSKDIVALMDHLTVRDAQRNARDTEILVTLVRSAAEMRNSFEDMKRLLAEQENNIINSTEKNTERSVQRVLQGPRPQPLGTPRVPRRMTAEEEIEDLPARRKNVFKRALKGLSMRSSNDLANIEQMLQQLLGDVEGLKASNEMVLNDTRGNSLNSREQLGPTPEGYEPEGQAGTGTNRTGSGYLSITPSGQASARRGPDSRITSDHRISTVPEGDEEIEGYDDELDHEVPDDLPTPTHERPERVASVPLETPTQPQVSFQTQSYSNENTPRTERTKKHKSNSSSLFPKISRWSETTASTVAQKFRGGAKKEHRFSEAPSRSGSDLAYWDEQHHDPSGADRLQSAYAQDDGAAEDDGRPPSPLIPAQDDPKYQAHRNSLNLQHPQPRPGPTYRYQSQLESEAHNFEGPASPSSDHWTSNPTINRLSGGSGNRNSGTTGHLSPLSDGAYSLASAADQSGPPRPPKIPDEPLVPQRPPKIRGDDNNNKPQYASPLSSGYLAPSGDAQYSQMNGGAAGAGAPRSLSGQVPKRKPTGPRPISSNSDRGAENLGAARRDAKRDTFGAGTAEHDMAF